MALDDKIKRYARYVSCTHSGKDQLGKAMAAIALSDEDEGIAILTKIFPNDMEENGDSIVNALRPKFPDFTSTVSAVPAHYTL